MTEKYLQLFISIKEANDWFDQLLLPVAQITTEFDDKCQELDHIKDWYCISISLVHIYFQWPGKIDND